MKRLLLRWLAAMALSLGAALLGIRFGAGIPGTGALHMGLFGFQLVCMIASPLLGLRWLRKVERLQYMQHWNPEAARQEARAHRDTGCDPVIICRWTVVYLAVLTASALAGSFFCGAGGTGIGTTQLLSLYVLYGMTGRLPWRTARGASFHARLADSLRFDDEASAVWHSLALVLPRKRLEYEAQVDLLLSREN